MGSVEHGEDARVLRGSGLMESDLHGDGGSDDEIVDQVAAEVERLMLDVVYEAFDLGEKSVRERSSEDQVIEVTHAQIDDEVLDKVVT